ncbi:MAG: acyltransferase [Candidatus Electrothrix sp. YB6]
MLYPYKMLYKICSGIKGIRFLILSRIQTFLFKKILRRAGDGLHTYFPCEITGCEFVEVGDNVHINKGAYIKGEGGVIIGDNVHIGRNFTLYTTNHNYKGKALPYDSENIKKNVTIGNNVWIGINVTIIPGRKISDGAIIGAGTVITNDVPRLAIVGSLSQIRSYRDKKHYDYLVKNNKYGGVNGKLYSIK